MKEFKKRQKTGRHTQQIAWLISMLAHLLNKGSASGSPNQYPQTPAPCLLLL